jgi:hypothetical protein
MKKTLFHLVLAISFAQTLNAQVVNIPDANFKIILRQHPLINTNNDTEIQVSEAEAFSGTIYVAQCNIKSLKGIEDFINIGSLSCGDNQITSLDLSKNIALIGLYCDNNQLVNLDLSKNIALTELSCSSNKLTTLDVSKNIELTDLRCAKNQLTVLDVSKNIALTTLHSYSNKLVTLDVSKNIALTSLYCNSNKLVTLDVSKNITLTDLWCDNNQFTNLDVSKNIMLTYLICDDNQLATLDISKNIALTGLDCGENKLTTLDISKNIALTDLYCDNNQLNILNLKNGVNNTLKELYAINNPQLKCIQVDDPIKIGINWIKDAQATYSADCNVSTNDNTATTPQFNLYPNPASQTLHIDWQGDATPIAITLYNSIGAAVKTQQLPQQGSINIADLPRGIYLCRINNANHQLQITKVIIE